MKKVFVLFLILAMAITAVSCSDKNENTDDALQTVPSQTEVVPTENVTEATDSPSESVMPNETQDAEQPSEQSNILIAYFSRVGNTNWKEGVDATTSASLNVVDGEFAGNAELLAQFVQEATGGDLFLIQTVDTYPSDYRETTDKAKVEQNENARPALASHVENMDAYDTIILIYPNWWGTLPQPLFTFLEEYDFSGKTILPLCTHGGSALGRSDDDIAKICPNANMLKGLAVSGSDAASARGKVEEWINKSGVLN